MTISVRSGSSIKLRGKFPSHFGGTCFRTSGFAKWRRIGALRPATAAVFGSTSFPQTGSRTVEVAALIARIYRGTQSPHGFCATSQAREGIADFNDANRLIAPSGLSRNPEMFPEFAPHGADDRGMVRT